MSPTTQGAHVRPALIYDGDCAICKRWVAYWEGLIDVVGTRAGAKVRGHGYMELTGYAGALVGLSQ